MTVTVTTIDQGPFTATGLAQTVGYTFMTLTDEEISVFYDAGDGRVEIDQALYTVNRNKNVDGSAKEGGSVVLQVGSAPAASTVFLRANPRGDRDIVWSDTGSRLKNLNEEADRQTLRALVLAELIGRALIVAPGSVAPSAQDVIDAAQAVALKANKDGSGMSPFQAASFLAAISGLPLDASGATLEAPDNIPYQAAGGLVRSLGAKAGQEQRSIFDFASPSRTGAQNTAGLTAALASGKLVHTDGAGGVSFPINGPIPVSAGAALIDPTGNSQAKIVCEAGNYSIFQRQGAHTTIKAIGIDATLNTAGAVFEHQISGDMVETRVSDVLIEGAYQIWKETFSSGKSFRTYLSNVKALKQRGPGYVMEHEFAFTYLDELCLVEYLNGASPNHTAFYYDGAIPGLMGAGGGLHLGLQIGGSKAISATSAQKGFIIKNTGGVWFRGARADTLGGEGCLIDTCNNVHFESFEAALNDGTQLRIKDSSFIFGSGMIALRGRNDQTTKTADVDNLVIQGAGSGFMTFPSGVVSQEATGHGALIDGGSVVLMSEYVGKSNTKRGIRTTSNVSIFVNKGGATFGNAVGNYDLATASHHLRDIVLESGALVNGVGPSTL